MATSRTNVLGGKCIQQAPTTPSPIVNGRGHEKGEDSGRIQEREDSGRIHSGLEN